MRRYEVSRAVLREAIRLLEQHQVVATKEGRGGGLVVIAPDSAAITRALELYLQYKHVTLSELLETKRALEIAALPLVAERLTSEGIDRLRLAADAELRRGEEVFEITEANIHLLLASLTGNPATSVFVEVLTRLSVLMVERGPAMESAPHAFEVHREIAEALASGDVPRAEGLMLRHLTEMKQRSTLRRQDFVEPGGGAGMTHPLSTRRSRNERIGPAIHRPIFGLWPSAPFSVGSQRESR